MKPHETFVHGSRRESWWWGCVHGCEKPNSYVFRRDAEAAAALHLRAVELARESDSGVPS